MRLPLLLALMLLTSSTLLGQSFTLSTSPRHQEVTSAGATFTVAATPVDGYSASIFLKASVIDAPVANVSVTPGKLNAPYSTTATVNVSLAGLKDGMTHSIVVEGSNGPLVVRDTVTITIPSRPAWQVFTTMNSPLPSNEITAIVADHGGATWIGTTAGLARYDGTTWTTFDTSNLPIAYPQPSNNAVSAIAVDSSGGVWVAEKVGRLARYFNGTWREVDPLAGKEWLLQITSIAAGDRFVWVAMKEGAYPAQVVGYDFIADTLTPPIETLGLLNGAPASLAVDHRGALWIASSMPYVGRFDGAFWTMYNNGDLGISFYPPLTDSHYEVSVDADGTTWLAGCAHLISIDAGGTVTSTLSYEALPKGYPNVAANDPSGALWVGTWAGLLAREGDVWEHYTSANSGLPADDIKVIDARSGNAIWIGTKAGLAILDPTAGAPQQASVYATERQQSGWSIFVAPNPITDRSTIELASTNGGHAQVTLVDALGRIERTLFDGYVEAGRQSLSVDMSDMTPGVRFIVVEAAGKRQVQMVTVAK